MSAGIIVVTTSTCPKCPAFKEEIRKLEGVEHIEFIDETRSDFESVCKKHNLTQAPVALLFDKDNKLIYNGDDIDELRKLL